MFIFMAHAGVSQSFEGVLTYSVTFELDGPLAEMKEEVYEKMRSKGEFFDTVKVAIKGGNYMKIDNKPEHSTVIYSSDQNKIFGLQEGFEYVTITDAANYNSLNMNFDTPDVRKVDSIKYVKGIPCNLVMLEWSKLCSGWYFFNKETASVDPTLFENHNFEFLNLVLSETGAYPLEIVQSVNQLLTVRMTLVSIEEKEVADNVFAIPELKKAGKKYARFVKQMTGNEVMKIKK